MSRLRILETNKGPMCGSCAAEKYTADDPDVYTAPWGYAGGYCAECYHVMPADGAPGGRGNVGNVACDDAEALLRRASGDIGTVWGAKDSRSLRTLATHGLVSAGPVWDSWKITPRGEQWLNDPESRT